MSIKYAYININITDGFCAFEELNICAYVCMHAYTYMYDYRFLFLIDLCGWGAVELNISTNYITASSANHIGASLKYHPIQELYGELFLITYS